tara:strand:+ start:499 stop:1083 length:585 start_codon:yes stop_codon:yes gene_type:complete
MKFTINYLNQFKDALDCIDLKQLEKIINEIVNIKKKNGRIFFLGVGGSAANASHAVNDFRKLCGIECYTPSDNVSELTARTNDEGWENTFAPYLQTSNLKSKDLIFIFSVGGGNKKLNVSTNLIKAIDYAKKRNSKVISIVGKKSGYAQKKSDVSLIVSKDNQEFVTPFSETFQTVIWHLIVSHPLLKINKTKW